MFFITFDLYLLLKINEDFVNSNILLFLGEPYKLIGFLFLFIFINIYTI